MCRRWQKLNKQRISKTSKPFNKRFCFTFTVGELDEENC